MTFLFTFTTFNNRDMHFNRTGSFTPKYRISEKDCTFFIFFFLGAQCVESGVICTDCY
jgi:hypothetical protein